VSLILRLNTSNSSLIGRTILDYVSLLILSVLLHEDVVVVDAVVAVVVDAVVAVVVVILRLR
jgi:hypothetical protein